MAAGGVAPPPPPYFRATTTDTALWLRRFDIQNTWEYLLALLVLFLLAALREVIGGAHRRLAASSRTRPGGALIARYSVEHQSAAPGGGIDHEALDREMLLGRQSMVRRYQEGRSRAARWLLLSLNTTLAYLLILAVTTWNVGFFVAVVAGHSLGHATAG